MNRDALKEETPKEASKEEDKNELSDDHLEKCEKCLKVCKYVSLMSFVSFFKAQRIA
jgi:phage-related protein